MSEISAGDMKRIDPNDEVWNWVEQRGVKVQNSVREGKFAYDIRLHRAKQGDHSGMESLVKDIRAEVPQNETPIDVSTELTKLWGDSVEFMWDNKIVGDGVSRMAYQSIIYRAYAESKYRKVINGCRKAFLTEYDDIETDWDEQSELCPPIEVGLLYESLSKVESLTGGAAIHEAVSDGMHALLEVMKAEQLPPQIRIDILQWLAKDRNPPQKHLHVKVGLFADDTYLISMNPKGDDSSHRIASKYLWMVHLASSMIAEDLRWQVEESLVFLLCGKTPPHTITSVGGTIRRDMPGLSRIVLEFEPQCTDKEILQAVEDAKKKLLKRSQVKAAGEAAQCVATYVYGLVGTREEVLKRIEAKEESWERLMDVWAKEINPNPGKPGWDFKYASRFRDAAESGYAYLASPELLNP